MPRVPPGALAHEQPILLNGDAVADDVRGRITGVAVIGVDHPDHPTHEVPWSGSICRCVGWVPTAVVDVALPSLMGILETAFTEWLYDHAAAS